MKRRLTLFLIIAFLFAMSFIIYKYILFLPIVGENSPFVMVHFPLPENTRQVRVDNEDVISFISLDSRDSIINFYTNELTEQGWKTNDRYPAKGTSFILDNKLGSMSGIIRIADIEIDDPLIGPTKVRISFGEIDYSIQR